MIEDVPVLVVYRPKRSATVMFTSGATTFGYTGTPAHDDGPRLDPLSIQRRNVVRKRSRRRD